MFFRNEYKLKKTEIKKWNMKKYKKIKQGYVNHLIKLL